MPNSGAAGYAITSARDFGKFVETLLAGSETMLRPGSVTQMETGVLPTGYNPRYAETYGFGLFIDQIGGETVIDHSGDIAPFHSAVFFVPEARFGVVMLINADSSKTIGKVMQEAVGLFAPPPAPLTAPTKTAPLTWAPYTGSYLDSYGALGAFSLTVDGSQLAVSRADGTAIGSLSQLDADHWLLTPITSGGQTSTESSHAMPRERSRKSSLARASRFTSKPASTPVHPATDDVSRSPA
jgi:hypothetical protein